MKNQYKDVPKTSTFPDEQTIYFAQWDRVPDANVQVRIYPCVSLFVFNVHTPISCLQNHM